MENTINGMTGDTKTLAMVTLMTMVTGTIMTGI